MEYKINLPPRNFYKSVSANMRMEKRGQVAIFVIVAIIIVVAGILIYYFLPGARTFVSGDITPSVFLSECVSEELDSNIELLSSQGGYANPEGFILHEGDRVKYLCYTTEYYVPCIVQQPLILRHYERELEELTTTKAQSCTLDLREEYSRQGYEVSGGDNPIVNVDIVPDKIRILVNAPMTVRKGDETISYQNFDIERPSEVYDLLMIATSIIDFESTYGDTETTLYYQYYPNLVIGKDTLTDGTTVFEVRDVTTEESFKFASRSLAWPGGYGSDA